MTKNMCFSFFVLLPLMFVRAKKSKDIVLVSLCCYSNNIPTELTEPLGFSFFVLLQLSNVELFYSRKVLVSLCCYSSHL